eukprot:TRINITY_DN5162_c0_g1_i2.p4 TRINITY_DN5162_c0_g1~~TRINITY_DN5162_c0_g1_i2.p4  ORF type:complete len:196 (+),score=5.78 TRINITY_DN5162_c0_g1_i2:689-1276(+)
MLEKEILQWIQNLFLRHLGFFQEINMLVKGKIQISNYQQQGEKNMKIVVAGTGYVGLVTGACLSEVGHNVTCVDIDEKKVEKMKQGISPIYEPGLDELLKRNHNDGRLDFTVDYKKAYKDADLVFIGVGTPEREDGSANLDYVYKVCEQIADNVENNCLVVVKSTVPIGTNDKICLLYTSPSPRDLSTSRMPSSA